MAQKANYKVFEEKYPGTIILQLRGNFYNAFDKSAMALADCFGYKLNRMDTGVYKCGFPASVLNERLDFIKNSNLGYVVFENGQEVEVFLQEDKSEFEKITKDFDNDQSPIKKMTSLNGNKLKSNSETIIKPFESINKRLAKVYADKPDFGKEACFNWILDEGLKSLGY